MELVLVLPVVVLALLLVIQVGVIARSQVLVVDAAREGARAAAVGGVDAAAPAARATPGLRAADLDVEATTTGAAGDGGLVHVRVSYHAPTDVALVGPLLGEPTLTAEVTMRLEHPG